VDKIVRLQCTAIEEKESSKWLLALRDTVALTPPGRTDPAAFQARSTRV
jgi:hypothetical protein